MKKRWPVLVIWLGIIVAIAWFTLAELQNVSVIGRVKANNIQNVMLGFPVRIEKILVQEGQRVTVGERLAALNLSEYQAQIKAKEQELVQARCELQNEGFTIKQLENRLTDARATSRQSQTELNNKQILYQKGAISKLELDQYEQTNRSNQKTVTDIELDLTAKRQGVSSQIAIRERIAKLELEVNSKRDKLRQCGISQNYLVTTVDEGVVAEINYRNGDQVQDDDQKQLLSVLDLHSLVVEAPIAERLIKDVQVGAAVTITPLADAKRHYRGTVGKIGAMAVVKNGETILPVEIRVQNPDRFLVPNLNVEIRIKKGKLL